MYIRYPILFFAEDGTGEAGGAPSKDAEVTKDSAIEEAVKDVEKDAGLNKKDKSDDDKKDEDTSGDDDKSEETSEEESEESESDDLSADEVLKARQLFKILKDPERGKILIEAMAKEAGIVESSSKPEREAAAKTIEELFVEELGDEYKFLSERMAKAVSKVLKVKIDEETKDLREAQKATAKAQFESEFNTAINKVTGEYKEGQSLLKDMYALMDTIKPGPGATQEKYFRTLLLTAAADKDIQLTKINSGGKDTSKNLSRARADVSSRLASEDKRSSVKEGIAKSKALTLEESIAAAEKEVEAKMGS